jgi:hypothetical protein
MAPLTTSSRARVTGWPLLFAPSPDTSTTRRRPLKLLSSKSGLANISAPEIDVREALR